VEQTVYVVDRQVYVVLLPLLLAVRVCSVCKGEKEGRLKGLCLLFYELGLCVGFL